MSNCGCGNKDITPTGCGCATSKKTCKQKSCACPVKDLSTDCIVLGVDLECTQVPKGKILTEALSLIDNFICEKFSSVTNYLTLKNIGGGAKAFKQTNLLGQKEIRTFTSADESITVSENANTIDLSASFCQPRSYKVALPDAITEGDSNVYVLRDSYAGRLDEDTIADEIEEIPGKEGYGIKLKYFANCADTEGQFIEPKDGNTYQAHINTVILSGNTTDSRLDGIVNYRQVSSALIDYSQETPTQATFRIGNGVFFNPALGNSYVNKLYSDSTGKVVLHTKLLHRYNSNNETEVNTEKKRRVLNQDGDDISNSFSGNEVMDINVLSDDTNIVLFITNSMYYWMIVVDSGTYGDANVTIDGVNYLMSFDTDFITTSDNFISTHKAALKALGIEIVTATLTGGLKKYILFTSLSDFSGGGLNTTQLSGDIDVKKQFSISSQSNCLKIATSSTANGTYTLADGFIPFATNYKNLTTSVIMPNGNLCILTEIAAFNFQIPTVAPATLDYINDSVIIFDSSYENILYRKGLDQILPSLNNRSDVKIEVLSTNELLFLDRGYYTSNYYSTSNRLSKTDGDLTNVDATIGSVVPQGVDEWSIPTDIKVLQDDSIMLAGLDVSTLDRAKLYRINSDGSLFVGYTVPTINGVYAVSAQSDGKLIISGLFSGFIKRLSSLGVTDNTFLSNFTVPSISLGSYHALNYVKGITVDSDDKIYVYGGFVEVSNREYRRIFKVTSDGELDTLNFYKFFTRSREMTIPIFNTNRIPNINDNQYAFQVGVVDVFNTDPYDRNNDNYPSLSPQKITKVELDTDYDANFIYLKIADTLESIPKHIAFEINIVETVGSLSTYTSS